MSDYDEERGFGLSHYQAIQNNIKQEPRFSETEREAIQNLITESECAVNAICGKCPRNSECPTNNFDGITIAAIATVRQMLAGKEGEE